ncbi:MAG TPA: aldehyde ferredoxin oxidoreductase, partial [Anaerolineae bacterium]|nr:aldehyde ferredoxin oxidoreductase [Anaerolineae bacterium]
RVNLTDGTTTKEPTPADVVRDYLGGRGLGVYLLYTEVPRGADPLGPENKLFISTGPLSGTLFPGAGKMDFTTKSPLTGGYASASMGGMLTAELRYAGYDAIIVEGMSDRPVYLFIEDDEVELRDASAYWGKGSFELEKELKDTLGEEFQIATVGPAGENLVRYACISHDFGRQAGRGGVGTVMGAKKLKAIAVHGTGDIPIADVNEFVRVANEAYQSVKEAEALEAWIRYGTMIVTEWCDENGALPTRNFQAGAFEHGHNIYADVMREKIVVTDKGCFACPSPCGKYSHAKKHGIYVEGPEYESNGMLGSNLALGDIEDIAKANQLCDELGLDSISTGGTIAWAMESYERGILTKEQTDGIDLRFGNAEAVFEVIPRIARREGWLGNLLAEGVKRAAAQVGQGSEKWAIHVKGMELSAYAVHDATSMLLAYMTADVGAHHNRAWAITYDIAVGRDKVVPEKAAKVIELQHIRPLMDALGNCRLQWVELDMPLRYYAPAVTALTGTEYSWEDLVFISERIWNLTRMFWVREIPGFGRVWDAPPPRFVSEPATYGPTKGKFTPPEAAQKMLDFYYEQRGWDENGIPRPETLEKFGLAELVKKWSRNGR